MDTQAYLHSCRLRMTCLQRHCNMMLSLPLCRHILSQLLSGNELTGARAMGEVESNAAINAARQKYSLKLVDVNSTNKGSPAGAVQSFSAMVVVGNHEVCSLQHH